MAKDVKFQVEFNPACVAEYRLIGYENRLLKDRDFENDKKDAGDLGSGHTVTALYELVPAGAKKLKYQRVEGKGESPGEWLTVRLRYKEPEAATSKLLEVGHCLDSGVGYLSDPNPVKPPPSSNFRFAAAVAGFGMLLRDSPHKAELTFEQVEEWARESKSRDPNGHKAEFIKLVKKAASLKRGAIARARND